VPGEEFREDLGLRGLIEELPGGSVFGTGQIQLLERQQPLDPDVLPEDVLELVEDQVDGVEAFRGPRGSSRR